MPPGGGSNPGRPTGPTTGTPGGPTTPRPTAPATGLPAGPSTGGQPGTGGGRGPTSGAGRGAGLDADLTTWDFWWEFNKDPFLRLRDAVHAAPTQTGSDDFYLGPTRRKASDSLRPSEQDVLEEVLPALKRAIDSTEQRDITSSCMVAMAKIGRDHPDFRLIDVFRPRLARHDQEIRETAALAVGIAAIAGEAELDLLTDLALDRAEGRAASGGEVDYRTRSFATYGLGLVANRTSNPAVKRRVLETLTTMLADARLRERNLQVAAIHGLGILGSGQHDDESRRITDAAVDALEAFYRARGGASRQLVQAHCPTAIARLLGRDHPRAEHFRALFADDLENGERHDRGANEIAQSCALALGQLVRPYDDADPKLCPDKRYSQLLRDTWHEHKDAQTKRFALLSLGFVGGERNREALLKEFDKAGKNQEKPWCALALGVLSHRDYEAQAAADQSVQLDEFVGRTLAEEFDKSKEPSLTGALAIALGLNRHLPAAGAMRARMLAEQHQEALAGYLAVGLALMDDKAAIRDIRDVVEASTRRFELLQQAAIALGKLGDKSVADQLLDLLDDGERNLARLAAIASAVGFIGDRRTIGPLASLLHDTQLGELSRAFAAVALGGIADKEPLPWNSKIAVHLNYRAAVETLTNRQTGVLDIL